MPSTSNARPKYNMALAHLFRLIPLMTEEQQMEMLKHAKRILSESKKVEKAREKQLAAGERKPSDAVKKPVKKRKEKRASIRKSCFLSVDFVTQDRPYTSFIRSLGAGGVFIESRDSFFPGDDIAMNFAVNDPPTPFKVSGEIAWCGPEGIGVEFKTLSKYQTEMLDKLVVQMVKHGSGDMGRVSYGRALASRGGR